MAFSQGSQRRKLCWLLLLPLAILVWNGRLIWSVSKPTVLAIVPAENVQVESSAVLANTFTYSRLGISAPLTDNPATSPLKSQDWSKIAEALRKGVDLAYSGESFNEAPLVYVTGHSSDTYPHAYAAIFAGLGQAKEGDTFTITQDQKMYTYKVIARKVVSPTDGAFFVEKATNPAIQRALLVTCWPPLTTRNRLVVIGERSITGNL